MRANPEIVIRLVKGRYTALYRQWKRSVAGLPTTTQVRLRLLSLLRAGIIRRDNLGVPENHAGDSPARAKRRGPSKKRKRPKTYHAIRCRIDPRLYPDVLDEWRALGKRTRSEIFAEYLRIGLGMTPEEVRIAALKVTQNMVWQTGAAVTPASTPAEAKSPITETMILPDSGKTDNAAIRMFADFDSLED